jgi:hypothetical protein
VAVLAERRVADPPSSSSAIPAQTIPAPTIPAPPSPPQRDIAWRAGFMGAMSAVALVVAVRMILLVAIAGAIGLAVIFRDGSPYHLGLLAIYTGAVVVPMIWLSGRK